MTMGTAELVGTSGNTFGVFGSILAEMFVQMLVACDFHQYVLLGHNFFWHPFRIIIYQSYNSVLHIHYSCQSMLYIPSFW